MKLSELKHEVTPEWKEKGYELPSFDVEAVRKKHMKTRPGYILVPEIFSGLSQRLYCRKRWIQESMTAAWSLWKALTMRSLIKLTVRMIT